jgi:hypothetical protein
MRRHLPKITPADQKSVNHPGNKPLFSGDF